ncbi:Thioredoxin reductase TrxB [Helicobacter sp. NHP19-012]|uniref:Thioredoxin reductase TrxB n=1 Tax=Helicobacter gastrofelis TaxID=2849642 RepID=A0ABN6IAM0_9HELI|nr:MULTISPECIES: NAD(P)-binding domain-containing protein [unclassified Helicobacter]BCZ19789.1 Thioredoxin reductase TrxB [Helicobacter sp. NHP19-012]GMB95466.1 Thioredoxin reductase TrxB [Helicobacter sp. NHP22-001]
MGEVYDVLVVGAGPGGIAATIECQINGISNVLLCEKDEACCGMLRKYYKAHKRVDKDYRKQVVDIKGHIPFSDTDKEGALEVFEKALAEYKTPVRYKTNIESVAKKGELFEVASSANEVFKARAVVIAIGKMGQPNRPSYPIPVEIMRQVVYTINDCKEKEEVLVVGGGNSAVEYAIALAPTNTTTLNYRQSTFSRVNEENLKALEEAFSRNLKSKLGVDILGLEGLEGRIQVNFADNTSGVYDRILYAIGGATPLEFLKKCQVQLENNLPVVSQEQESNIENLFVVGDILYKSGASIGIGLNGGFDVAQVLKSRLA